MARPCPAESEFAAEAARVGDRARGIALLLATLLVLALAFASRADAYVYWASDSSQADQPGPSTTTGAQTSTAAA